MKRMTCSRNIVEIVKSDIPCTETDPPMRDKLNFNQAAEMVTQKL